MTIREALAEGRRRLTDAPDRAHVETPELDASVLLAEALGTTREKLYAGLPDTVGATVCRRYLRLIKNRVEGLPVSYICRRKEFFGLTFTVGPGVLVPRPDTEILVEAALSLAELSWRVHDSCTGSGCVAIALKYSRPDLDVSASDISDQAAGYFGENCRCILGTSLVFSQSDMLAGVEGPFDLITANPPYLSAAQVRRLTAQGWPEPALALDGGPTGPELVLRLLAEAPSRLVPGGFLAMEADAEQVSVLADRMRIEGWTRVVVHKDLAGLDRVVVGRRPGEVPRGRPG
jgi:release factor glutamine methyltransferase